MFYFFLIVYNIIVKFLILPFFGKHLNFIFFLINFKNKFKTDVLAFAKAINLATPINLLTHYAKGTLLFYLYIRIKFQLLIELLFQIFLHSTFHYR